MDTVSQLRRVSSSIDAEMNKNPCRDFYMVLISVDCARPRRQREKV
jgi:hypothetical protein